MGPRRIRLTAMTGHPVTVFVYDSVDEMRRAATRWNGQDHSSSWGTTSAYVDDEQRTVAIVIRLCRESLGAKVVAHELHHAAAAIYGSGLGDRVSRTAHFTHYNEAFAHLFSELVGKLNHRLWELGYYDAPA